MHGLPPQTPGRLSICCLVVVGSITQLYAVSARRVEPCPPRLLQSRAAFLGHPTYPGRSHVRSPETQREWILKVLADNGGSMTRPDLTEEIQRRSPGRRATKGFAKIMGAPNREIKRGTLEGDGYVARSQDSPTTPLVYRITPKGIREIRAILSGSR